MVVVDTVFGVTPHDLLKERLGKELHALYVPSRFKVVIFHHRSQTIQNRLFVPMKFPFLQPDYVA